MQGKNKQLFRYLEKEIKKTINNKYNKINNINLKYDILDKTIV